DDRPPGPPPAQPPDLRPHGPAGLGPQLDAVPAEGVEELPPLAGAGQSITFGLTLVLTASRMSRPAKSIAAAVFHGRSMPALWAAMTAVEVFGTLPRAR